MKLKKEKVRRDLRRLKHGSYSVALSAIVVAGAVVLNLVAGELPSQFTKFDLSGQQLTSITDQTKEILAGLEEDITLYYIVQDSSRDSYISRLLERYEDSSSHITVVEKDPVLYPQFASQYTEETVSDNSVIAVCGDESRVISYEEMYEQEFSYTYYTYQTTGFDAEGQLTSAIAALDSGVQPKLYILTGHNELEIGSTLSQSIEKENMETETLNLVTADAVPEDADCLLIASPTVDLSDSEAQKVLNYLRRGGSVIAIVDYTQEEMPNLDSVLAYYGVERTDGVVIEGSSNYYVQLPYYLVPDINSTEVSDTLTGGTAYVLLAAAQGLQSSADVRDSVNLTSVLTTSENAYSKVDIQNMTTYEKESDDIDGPFDLGVLVTETVELTDELLKETAAVTDTTVSSALDGLTDGIGEDDETDSADTEEESETEELSAEAADTAETKLAVYTSSSLIDESANQMVSGGNFSLFINTLSWACGQETSVSVPVKSLSVDSLVLTSASSSFWSIVTIGVIPGAVLLGGLGIWLSRRKR